MSMKSAQRVVARPMIARNGGTYRVDLAVGPDRLIDGSAEHGRLEEISRYTDDNGDTEVRYQQRLADPKSRNPNTPGMAWPFGRNGGAGDVIITEPHEESDHAYQTEDVQPEPSEADGEGQNSGGAQEDQDDSRFNTRAQGSRGYRGRSGGIG